MHVILKRDRSARRADVSSTRITARSLKGESECARGSLGLVFSFAQININQLLYKFDS